MSVYDFNENPRSWQFTGELKAIKIWNTFRFGFHIGYQWVFEKQTEDGVVRIGIMIDKGRVTVQDPPAGE